MVMPQASYIVLEPEKPKRLRFDHWAKETRKIIDPKSRMQKDVQVMVFHVTEEDGQAVDTIFSALAFKLQQTLAPLIDSGQLFTREITLTYHPRDYSTEYTVALS